MHHCTRDVQRSTTRLWVHTGFYSNDIDSITGRLTGKLQASLPACCSSLFFFTALGLFCRPRTWSAPWTAHHKWLCMKSGQGCPFDAPMRSELSAVHTDFAASYLIILQKYDSIINLSNHCMPWLGSRQPTHPCALRVHRQPVCGCTLRTHHYYRYFSPMWLVHIR